MECKDGTLKCCKGIRLRINRDIVECKVFKVIFVILNTDGINRDIVECKERAGILFGHSLIGINRDIVECKVRYRTAHSPAFIGINRNIVECKDGSPASGKGAGQWY